MIDLIQAQLENTYGLSSELKVSDFLVDETAARALGGTARAREELLVSEGAEGLELALYLHPSLSHPQTLGEFCEVVEGVSHFLYLAHTAKEERRVSLLELEAQAEVDKFIVCVLRRGFRGGGLPALLAALFERVSLHAHLTEAERWRYAEANRLARSYARRLVPLILTASLERFLAEVRHMYRLGADAKLRYFAQLRPA